MKKTSDGIFLSGLRRLFDSVASTSSASAKGSRQQQRSGAGRTAGAVGRFSVVSLSHVREQLGERWPGLAERVHDLAETVISRYLMAGDVFELNADGDYVVLFCQLGEREAEFKARAIATEITRRLLGSDWGRPPAAGAVTSDVRHGVADRLDEALATPLAKDARFADPDQKAAGPRPDDQAHPASSSATVDGQAAKPQPGLETFPAASSSAAAPGVAVPIRRRSSALRYVPIWDFSRHALIHFRAVAADEDEGKGFTGPALHQAVFSSNLSAMKKAVADIVRLAGLDRRLPVTCPMSAEALEFHACRRALLDELKDLPLHIRRLLMIELTVPPHWRMSNTIDRFLAAIKGLKIGVCARLPVSGGSLSMLAQLPGPVTAELPATALPEASCIKYLDAFADRALKAQLECGVAGVCTRSLAMAASAAGFRFLSGPAIHPEIANLDQATRFDLAQLYEDLLPRRG